MDKAQHSHSLRRYQEYHSKYKLKEIDETTIKYVVRDGGYNPDETETQNLILIFLT